MISRRHLVVGTLVLVAVVGTLVLVALVALGSTILYQYLKLNRDAQPLKLVRISNVVEIYYPNDAKALVSKKRDVFRFDWHRQHLYLSFQVENYVRTEEESTEEILQMIVKGREAEGRQLIQRYTIRTDQGIIAPVLVFEKQSESEVREFIVIQNPYLEDHLVVVRWSASKNDYEPARQQIHRVVRRIRLLNGPPIWINDDFEYQKQKYRGE